MSPAYERILALKHELNSQLNNKHADRRMEGELQKLKCEELKKTIQSRLDICE